MYRREAETTAVLQSGQEPQDKIFLGVHHAAACTRSVVAVAGVAQWLCGAANVVNIATDGPCGVAARGRAGRVLRNTMPRVWTE